MNTNRPKVKVSLIVSALVLILSPYASYAKTEDFIDRFAANDIMFYNPDECGDLGSSSSLSGSNTKEKLWNYFRGKGLNEAQTAGVLGNVSVESSFIVAAMTKDNQNYWGLFQMNRDDTGKGMYDKIAAAGLSKYVDLEYGSSDSKIPANDLNNLILIQLDWAWNDFAKGWQAKLQGKEGDEHEAEWAAESFLVNFEGAIETSSTPGQELQYYSSSSRWQGAELRVSRAQEIYKEFKGTSTSSTAKSGSGYSSSDICCDPNGSVQDGVYLSTKYALTDGQVAGLAAIAAAENGGSTASVKTEASLMANLFEYKKPSSKGDADGLVNYVRTGGWFASSTTSKYSESYSNSTYVAAVKDVLVNGNRTIPPQVVEHDCFYSSGCSAGIGSASNNGKEISLSDKSEFKRGVTQLTQKGFSDNITYTFWGWADPEKKSGDPFGYLNSNPPSDGVLNSSKGSSSTNATGTTTVWSDGWITNGLDGYMKNAATTSSLSGLDTNEFGKEYSTTSARGTDKGPDKVTISITGTNNAGGSDALKLYEGNPYPPHFTIDLKNHKTWQHGSINKTAAAKGKSGKNDSAGVQVALIGTKSSSDKASGYNLSSDKDFSSDDWKYVGEVLTAISVETGIGLPDKLTSGKDMTDVIMSNVKKGVSSFSASQNKVCSDFSGKYAKFWELLVKIAYPKHYTGSELPDDPMPYYAELVKKTSYRHGGCDGQDCGGFVGILMRESGWDKNYQPAGTDPQLAYVSTGAGKNKWREISDEVKKDDSNMEPADVLITPDGHTLVYVGDVPDSKWDKNAKFASASLCSRWPQAEKRDKGYAYTLVHSGEPWGSHRKYRIFRRVNNNDD